MHLQRFSLLRSHKKWIERAGWYRNSLADAKIFRCRILEGSSSSILRDRRCRSPEPGSRDYPFSDLTNTIKPITKRFGSVCLELDKPSGPSAAGLVSAGFVQRLVVQEDGSTLVHSLLLCGKFCTCDFLVFWTLTFLIDRGDQQMRVRVNLKVASDLLFWY